MTEEEKKAIEEIKKFKFTESEKVAEENGLEHAEFARFLTIYHRKQLNILLNLIEKLQKENEDLNNRDTSRLSEIGELRTKNNYLENEIKYYYIPKDKIEKIKNKNIGQYMNFYREIEELLEED